MIRLNWTELKQLTTEKSTSLQYIERSDNYHIFLVDGNLIVETHIKKSTPSNADQTDFEDNFKSSSNKTLAETDLEGRHHVRVVTTKKGWSYLAHVLEFESSKLNSLYSNKWDGTSRGDVTIKFYDSSDVEQTTQTDIDANAVKTEILFKPDYDYELISGAIHQRSAPSEDLRLWVIGGAPELGAAGVSEFVGGLNLYHMSAGESIKTDGRSTKYLKKVTSGVPYNTNQLKIILRHSAGFKHKIKVIIEYYRS